MGPQIIQIADNIYEMDGLISVDELNDELDLEIDSENYDTISGFLIDELGFIPAEGDNSKVELDNLVFELVSVKEKRIEKVRLYLPEQEEEQIQ
jgi:putative hemolysin